VQPAVKSGCSPYYWTYEKQAFTCWIFESAPRRNFLFLQRLVIRILGPWAVAVCQGLARPLTDKEWLILGGVLVNKNFQINYFVRLLIVCHWTTTTCLRNFQRQELRQETLIIYFTTGSRTIVKMAKEKVRFELNDPAAVKQERNELISSTGLPCVLWWSRYQLHLYV